MTVVYILIAQNKGKQNVLSKSTRGIVYFAPFTDTGLPLILKLSSSNKIFGKTIYQF
jgi:hypothetical protein